VLFYKNLQYAFPFFPKEICEKEGAGLFRNSPENLWPMVASGLVKDAGTMIDPSSFWVKSPKENLPDTGEGQSGCTHGAGLQRDI
jgi:hypothetical protein